MGTLFSTERSPLFSTACLPHHRSYQATLSGPEWTRWHGSTELRPPSLHPTLQPPSALSRTLFVLRSLLLFLILSVLLSTQNIFAPFPLCIFCVSPRSPAVSSIRLSPLSPISESCCCDSTVPPFNSLSRSPLFLLFLYLTPFPPTYFSVTFLPLSTQLYSLCCSINQVCLAVDYTSHDRVSTRIKTDFWTNISFFILA